ncbi:MAG: SDR family oxidoreductase [Chthonomonadales bacterium]
MPTRSRILVTGAAGFIGSHLVRRLLADGYLVRALDDLSTGKMERLGGLLDRIEFRQADICDPDVCAWAVEGVEGVLHEAALPSVARSLEDPRSADRVNVGGTVTLLEACRRAGVRRLVLAGSSSVYGDSAVLPKVETMDPAPLSPYAASKLAAEYYCSVFAHLGYVETVSLRYFNVFGPMQDPASEYAAVIPKFITALLEGRPVCVHGDGEQSRDFTYIENVVEANLLALNSPKANGHAINIGCGERTTLLQLIAELERITGRRASVEHGPPRPGDVPHSLADINKARNLLGYNPKVDLRQGLQRTVEWFAAGTSVTD